MGYDSCGLWRAPDRLFRSGTVRECEPASPSEQKYRGAAPADPHQPVRVVIEITHEKSGKKQTKSPALACGEDRALVIRKGSKQWMGHSIWCGNKGNPVAYVRANPA